MDHKCCFGVVGVTLLRPLCSVRVSVSTKVHLERGFGIVETIGKARDRAAGTAGTGYRGL